MEPRKTCANCAFFEEHNTQNNDSDGLCTNVRLNGRLCFATDNCNLWETNAEKNKKEYLKYLLSDLSLNLKELSEVLNDFLA